MLPYTDSADEFWRKAARRERLQSLGGACLALLVFAVVMAALVTGRWGGLGAEDPDCPQSLRDSYTEAGASPPDQCY